MLMELVSHMVHHGNMCGALLQLTMKLSLYILAVHVFIQPFGVSSPALLVMITTVKLAAEQDLRDATTLTTLSGMVRGVRGRISAVTEEDRGSVSSCLNIGADSALHSVM